MNKRLVKTIHDKFGKPYQVWNERINIATYGYATSVHKSQGSEWDSVYIDASWLSDKWDKARWLYTAITRSKRKVELKNSNQFQVVNG
jgi:exodeoxyribonuclease-5